MKAKEMFEMCGYILHESENYLIYTSCIGCYERQFIFDKNEKSVQVKDEMYETGIWDNLRLSVLDFILIKAQFEELGFVINA